MSAESKLQLAEAYMQIVPSMKGAQGIIAQSLGAAGDEGDKAGRKAGSRFTGAFSSGLSGVGKIAAGVLGGQMLFNGLTKGLGAAKAAVFGFNSTLQNSSIAFTTMLGSGQKAQTFVGQLQQFAAKTPFDFQGLVQNSQTMIGMGVSAKAVLPTLSALGDSVASVGGNSTTLNNTISAFSQTMAKGTLDMGNMNQLLQGGVPTALKVLAAQYHVTTGQMVKMISAGKVQSSEALPLLVKGLEQGTSATAALGGMMDKQSQTFSGAAANIADGATQLTAKAFKPLFDISSVGLQAMAARLSSPVMTTAATKIASGLTFVTSRMQDLQARASNFDFGALLHQAAPTLKAVVDIARSLSPLNLAFHVIAPLLPVLAQALGTLAATVAGSLQSALLAILPAVAGLAGTLAGTLSKALVGLAPLLTVVVGMLAGQLGAALTVLLPVLANVALVLLNMANGLLSFLQPALSSPGVILAVVGALVAWKAVQGGIGFVGLVGGLIKSTVQLGLNTLGWVRNTAAMVVSKGETVILLGMYGADFVGRMAKATAALALQALGWVKNTAAMLASKAQTVILLGMYGAQFVGSVARATGALALQAAAWVASTAAGIAAKVALLAGAAATGIATAAQWALNAALDANPIGLVVIAIAALVAGLVYFFTQTKLGKAVWTDIVGFLKAAWATLVSTAKAAWGFILGAVTTAVRTVRTVVANVIGLLVAGWRLEWAVITTVVRTVWTAIHSAVSTAVNAVRSVVVTVIKLLVAGWRAEWALITGVVGAVWSGIKTVVGGAIKAVHNTVTGVLGSLRSAWSAAWGAISRFVGSAWSAISGAVSRGIGGVVSLARGIGGKVLGAIGNASGLLLGVGRNIVDGLVNGVRNAWGTVTTVIHNLAMAIPEPIRKALGIHSPSRVFMAIGAFLGQGLALGVDGTHAQVGAAMTKLRGLVTSAFDTLAKQREAAQKKLSSLDRQYADTSRLTAAGRKRRAELASQIRDQKAAVAQLTRLDSRSAESGVTRLLAADNKRLLTLAAQRDQVAAKLKTAQTALADQLTAKADFASQVKSAAVDLGNVATAYSNAVQARSSADGTVDSTKQALTDLATKRVADVAAAQTKAQQLSIAKQQATLAKTKAQQLSAAAAVTRAQAAYTTAAAKVTVDDGNKRDLQATLTSATKAQTLTYGQQITATLRKAIDRTRQFSSALRTLGKWGLDTTTLQQLITAGVDGGGLAGALELIKDGKSQVVTIASLQGQLKSAAGSLGGTASGELYNAGVNAAQGVVNGLKSQQKAITNVMDSIADSMVTSIKRKLKIKSPSRRFHDEVGVQIGAGLAGGVESTYGRVGRSIDGLVTVPKVPRLGLPGTPAGHAGGGLVQNFNGPMGYTADELAAKAAAKARRALSTVNIPKVVVQ